MDRSNRDILLSIKATGRRGIVRIGVIGAGKIGRLRIQSIIEHPKAGLAAVMDTSAEAAASAVQGTEAHATTDFERFFAADMDAVVISTPAPAHEAACLAAFDRGWHVLCEKPLSNTVESCRRIVQAAIAAKRTLGVGFNLRYYPAFRFVKDTVARGAIGDIDHLRVFGGHEGLPKFTHEWEYKAPASGGGAMMDVGIHMTDLTRYILGDITEVYGVMSESVWHVPGSEDNAMAVLRNPEGVTALYHATWTEWKGYGISLEVYGNRGMVRGSYAPMQNLLITQDRPGGSRRTKRRLYPEIILREKAKTWRSTALISFRDELADFIAMTEGRTDVAIADGYAGQRSVEVAEAVRRCTESHEVIHLPVLGRMPTAGGTPQQ
ncbi:MAG: Gfo/Idh/MocA family oxidoreductase [Pseudomonadota bacterium]|nr:Gfo/Idh/MocA family oxidoreductase [Pseudomonadota bacterium]